VDAVTVHYHHLVATEHKPEADELRATWSDGRLTHQRIDTSGLALWPFIAIPAIDLADLPPYTFVLQFPFRLTKSYISKDECDFYIMDNPVRRDRVFQLPYVAPSSWKGSLRGALWKLGYDETRPSIRRLFGNEKGAEEDFRAGRLRFFPSFFSRHGLEIINPHDRERKVGTKPILFESVPAGTPAVFSLLYVPFDRAGQDEAQTRREVAEDLGLVADGVCTMLCVYGFGAKTSSGYGIAGDNFVTVIDGRREKLPEGSVVLKAVLGEPAELRAFRQAHGRLDLFSSAEWQELLDDDEFQAYQAARAAGERYQQNVETQQISQEVQSFTEMATTLKAWASALRQEVSHE
jgi:CRISPR/Cas system CSM-associated protein Csm3 (group 7 of RAMP superfamily)